jgi:hypothetical protein
VAFSTRFATNFYRPTNAFVAARARDARDLGSGGHN